LRPTDRRQAAIGSGGSVICRAILVIIIGAALYGRAVALTPDVA
jgi:hypothetical protein